MSANFKVYRATDYNNDYLFDLPPSSDTIIDSVDRKLARITSIPASANADTIISITGLNLLNISSVSIVDSSGNVILPGSYSIESDNLVLFTVPSVTSTDNFYIQVSSSSGVTTFGTPINIIANPVDKTYLHQEIFRYTGIEDTFEIRNITENTLTVIMIAGGGCGGESRSFGGFEYSGGGGGGGGAIVNVPVTILSDQTITLKVGGGGTTLGTDGGDSYIIIGSIFYAVSGGKAAIFDTGGSRGIGLQDGHDGINGSVQLPSGPVVLGGIGGQSFVGYGGGKKQPRLFPDVVGYGGGGKGMDNGSSTIGQGQDGIIILTYASA